MALSDGEPWEVTQRGYTRYSEQNIHSAIHAYEEAHRISPESAGVLHNLAVLYYRIGDLPRAIYAEREAIRLVPRARLFRETLEVIETDHGIVRTVPPKQLIHPDVFLGLTALVVNAIFVVLALWRKPRGGGVIILVVLLC